MKSQVLFLKPFLQLLFCSVLNLYHNVEVKYDNENQLVRHFQPGNVHMAVIICILKYIYCIPCFNENICV